jgi:hypothetical protein
MKHDWLKELMEAITMSNSGEEKLKTYEQLCISYRAIDEFRAKLLTVLPLVTGVAIFLLVNLIKNETKPLLLPIGILWVCCYAWPILLRDLRN